MIVERWFAEITNRRIRRGIFRTVKELESPREAALTAQRWSERLRS